MPPLTLESPNSHADASAASQQQVHPIYLGDLQVTSGASIKQVKVSGHFLIIVERQPSIGTPWYLIRVIDLTTGQKYSLLNTQPVGPPGVISIFSLN
ncbi:hypothetical protein DL93DRAFT_2078017 [Clavulina sp. PMI_390]|nr:hypothetical protein DL93DRAFT_2078017 [Clavulina sp. PMI_390]